MKVMTLFVIALVAVSGWHQPIAQPAYGPLSSSTSSPARRLEGTQPLVQVCEDTIGRIAAMLDSLPQRGASRSRSSPQRVAARWQEEEDKRVYKGVCKMWDSVRGFGFVTMPDEKKDIFVHHSDLFVEGFRGLAVGEHVQFRIAHAEHSGRTKAAHVTLTHDGFQKQPAMDEYDEVFNELFGI